MTLAILGSWALAIVLIGVLRPAWLLTTAIVMSVFEGAALVKAGAFGLPPYYLTLLLIAARCVATRVTPATVLGPTPAARKIMFYSLLFTAVAVAGSVVLPRVFAGMEVNSPRLSDIGPAELVPSGSNTGQAVYLLLNVMLMWFVVQQHDTATVAKSAVRGMVIAGFIVVVMAFYQLASSLTGLPFPDDVLYSNDTFVSQSGTLVLDMPRICSTFTEPAGMAVFLVAMVALLTEDVGRAVWRVPLLLGTIAALLLSTSSTGYIGLAAVGAWRVGTNLFVPLLRGRLSTRQVILTVVGIAVVLGAIVCSATLRDLITAMVFEKDQSASYTERSDANALAWHIGYSTAGLGAGLGSNRASAFLPSLFSTTGVAGVVLLAAMLIQLFRGPVSLEVRPAHRALAAALLGVIGMKVLSSPDVSTPSMWALMAALLATHAVTDKPAPTVVAAQPVPRFPAAAVRGLA